MATFSSPNYSEVVERAIRIQALEGSKDTFAYLWRFPEEIYNKSPDSRLYKFMRSVLGEAGVNWIRKNHFEARMVLEELGIDAFNLDGFFGSPFQFGRIMEESLDADPYGIIPKADWEKIRAKNARYRNRALDFVNGARAGNTPEGMRYVARAGLGHDVEILENYRYLFDQHSDDPIGLEYYGKTLSTEEMIVLPRREVGQSEAQMVAIYGEPDWPTSGSFYFVFNGVPSNAWPYRYAADDPLTYTIPFDATRDHIRLALEAIPSIGPGNVEVTGGPGPYLPWVITFTGKLAALDVPELEVQAAFDTNARTEVTTLVGGIEAVDEVVELPAKELHNLQSAIDRIRAQTTIMTVGSGRGLRSRNNWKEAFSASEYIEVVRFVRGNPNVVWPAVDPSLPYWVEANKEKQAPRIAGDMQYHYTAFHDIAGVEASGATADGVLADFPEPLFITASTEWNGRAVSMVNGIYPQEYRSLPGAPGIVTRDTFWSSRDWDRDGATQGMEEDEWLVFKFPFVKCVNYLTFDIIRDDVEVIVEYDAYDGIAERLWVEATPVEPYNNVMVRNLDTTENTWASVGLTFTNSKGELVWTRAIRMKLHRTDSSPGHWGYPIYIRNWRAGRNVA